MPPEERDVALLADMLQAARAVLRYTAGKTLHNYLNDDLFQAAVERRIEIIGEAANGISATFKKAHPEFNWRGIIKQRHVLAHAYGRINHQKIRGIATERTPELVRLLEPHVPQNPET